MNVDGVFLVSAENKDTYCLDPLKAGLSSRFGNVHSLNFFDDINDNDGAILTEFARCTFPIAIISSAAMAGFLELIRPRESFLCIGLEHGIAPFKSYTYGRHLLSSDFYLAPTRGWAERLARLYPDARSQIRIGGYPKIEAIKERIETNGAPTGNLLKRILVILSWGVDEEAFKFLPDLHYIDYVLHPADYKLLTTVNLEKARIYVSNPDITYDLISSASVVIGDFSSLTLECIYLNKHVVFMVDRSIYKSNCDMDAQFFNEDSSEFGIIPESGGRINIEDSITATQFACLATTFGADIDAFKARTTRASFDPIFLPPADKNNVELCAEEICKLRDLAGAWTPAKHYSEGEAVRIVTKMCFISSSYQSILGRPSDRTGLRYYLRRITEFNGSALHGAVSVWHEISKSPEAMRRNAADNQELPRISYPNNDPLKSAHSFAAKDRLVEALYWVTKAIESQPAEGEYLRFKASILERMGRFEEALESAHLAQTLGADPGAISADIDRINSQLVARIEAIAEQLLPAMYRQQRNVAVCDAERIRLGMKLASAPDVDVDDLVQLAHACAAEERLADALYWIGKAIELKPDQGEHLRFKASILERMGRLADAQNVAIEAQGLGADPDCIGLDIDRINSLHVMELWKNADSDNRAASLASYSQLLAMGELSLRDVMKFARKLVKATA